MTRKCPRTKGMGYCDLSMFMTLFLIFRPLSLDKMHLQMLSIIRAIMLSLEESASPVFTL